jgi:transposase
LLDGFHGWLEAMLAKVSRKSETAAAIHYDLSRWTRAHALCRRTPGERQNAAERSLHVIARGCKNYYSEQPFQIVTKIQNQ